MSIVDILLTWKNFLMRSRIEREEKEKMTENRKTETKRQTETEKHRETNDMV